MLRERLGQRKNKRSQSAMSLSETNKHSPESAPTSDTNHNLSGAAPTADTNHDASRSARTFDMSDNSPGSARTFETSHDALGSTAESTVESTAGSTPKSAPTVVPVLRRRVHLRPPPDIVIPVQLIPEPCICISQDGICNDNGSNPPAAVSAEPQPRSRILRCLFLGTAAAVSSACAVVALWMACQAWL